MVKFVSDLLERPDFEMFHAPVDLEEVPDYLDVIKNPIDLQTMLEHIGKGIIKTLEDLREKYNLMFLNAFEYNTETDSFHKKAKKLFEKKLFETFEKEWHKHEETFLQNQSSVYGVTVSALKTEMSSLPDSSEEEESEDDDMPLSNWVKGSSSSKKSKTLHGSSPESSTGRKQKRQKTSKSSYVERSGADDDDDDSGSTSVTSPTSRSESGLPMSEKRLTRAASDESKQQSSKKRSKK